MTSVSCMLQDMMHFAALWDKELFWTAELRRFATQLWQLTLAKMYETLEAQATEQVGQVTRTTHRCFDSKWWPRPEIESKVAKVQSEGHSQNIALPAHSKFSLPTTLDVDIWPSSVQHRSPLQKPHLWIGSPLPNTNLFAGFSFQLEQQASHRNVAPLASVPHFPLSLSFRSPNLSRCSKVSYEDPFPPSRQKHVWLCLTRHRYVSQMSKKCARTLLQPGYCSHVWYENLAVWPKPAKFVKVQTKKRSTAKREWFQELRYNIIQFSHFSAMIIAISTSCTMPDRSFQ